MINRLKNRKFQNPSLNISPINTRTAKNSKSPIISTTVRNHTPNSIRYSKYTSRSPFMTRHQQFFKTENFTAETEKTLLRTLKSRKIQKKIEKPSPQLAQSVLKLYFLPFFQEQHKIDGDKTRNNSYGCSRKPNLKQSILSLSDILKKLLKEKQSELQKLRSKLNSVLKEKKQMKQTLKSLKQSKFVSKINFYSLSQSKNENFGFKTALYLSLCQSEKLSFFTVYIENLLLKKSHSAEKSSNLKLKNQSIVFKLYHNQSYMTNQLSGESLKGAYYSLTALKNQSNTETALKSISTSLKSSTTTEVQKNDQSFFTFSIIFSDWDKFFTKSKTVVKTRADIFKDIKSKKNAIIFYIETLVTNIKENFTQQESLKTLFESKEKEFFKFIDDYKNVQTQLEDLQKARNANELLCKFCNKEFLEADNFNWSCCSHPSEWSGEMFWCCGAKSKLSVGCQKRKHEVKAEEAEKDDLVEYNKQVLAVKFCTGCRKTGHSWVECEQDPNRLVRVEKRDVKKKRGMVNRSLSIRKLWSKDKEVDEDSFGDIEDIKRLTSREGTQSVSARTKSPGLSGYSSPTRSYTLSNSSSFVSRHIRNY